MKVRHILLTSVAIAAVVAVAGGWWLYASRNALLKRAIEEFGPQLTGVSITVRKVSLEPVDGKGAITGLVVGSPAGYKAPNTLALGEMRLVINASSLASNVIHVRELSIVAPVITYERGPGGDNMTSIQKHIDQEVAKLSAPGEAKSSGSPGKKFIIDHLYVHDAKVNYGAVTLPMPNVHLRDIGKRSNGASAGEVVKAAWGSIAGGVTNLASHAGGAIKEGASGALDKARGLVK